MNLARVAGVTFAMSVGFVPALAQTVPPPSPEMTPPTDPMQPEQPQVSNTLTGNSSAAATTLSSEDQRKWGSCKRKSAGAMMKTPACVTLLQSHPELQSDVSRPK
jgi:hypothetical protein